MRQYMIIYLLFMLFSLNLFATDEIEVPIKTLIENIKNAKVEDRRNLMNQLKLRLREMNKESRQKTIINLKKSLNRRRECQPTNRATHNQQERQYRRQPRYRHIQRHRQGGRNR